MTSVIITGATGTAGSAVLNNALANPLISHVTVLARRAPKVTSDKLTTVIIPSDENPKGFSELTPATIAQLKGSDAVIWALGISQLQVSKDEYNTITYDYTKEAAKAFAPLGTKDKPFRFVFVSGMGADQSGKSSTLFAKVKGQVERELVADETESFKTVNLRPGGIVPAADHAHNLNFFNRSFLTAFNWLLPSQMIKSDDLAVAAVNLAAGRGWDERDAEHVIYNKQLLKMAQDFSSQMAPQ